MSFSDDPLFPHLDEKERFLLKKLMRVTREQPPFWTYARVQRLIFAIAVSVFVMLLPLPFEGPESQHCRICEYGTLKAINGKHLITVCTTNKRCDGYVSNKILLRAHAWTQQVVQNRGTRAGAVVLDDKRNWRACVQYTDGWSFPDCPEGWQT